MIISLPQQKLKSLRNLAKRLRDQGTVTARQLAQLLGMMVAAHPAVLPAPYITLLEPGESEDEDRSYGSLPNTGGPDYGHGAAVVDRQGKQPQWQTPTNHTVGPDNRDRRIYNGMGCVQSGGENRRRMDCGRETASHKLSQAFNRVTCTKDLGGRSQHPPPGRQCDCNRFSQQNGRD